MKLHLGCGTKHLEGYVNVDVRELPGVDVVDEVDSLGKFENNSADLIYACHVLEHFGRLEYMMVLRTWYSVLKVGGMLRVAVPDIEQTIAHYNKHHNLKHLRGLFWGGQTYSKNYHYMGWDFASLKTDLEEAGFKNVERYDWRTTEHAHVDDYSQIYDPHMDKENGMLLSLNVTCQK